MKYSLAFTTYNSSKYIISQIERNYFEMSNNRVDEIIIQDDFSEDYSILQKCIQPNIKIFQNEKNLSPLLSRINLLQNCSNDYVLLMDSDNFLDKRSFDKINNLKFEENVIFCADWARPYFNFKQFSDIEMDLEFVKKHIEDTNLKILLNTGNYFVPRKRYLEISQLIDPSFAYFTVDVIYFNYLWLKENNKLKCVKDYEYDHTFRNDSYYMTNCLQSEYKLKEVIQLYINS